MNNMNVYEKHTSVIVIKKMIITKQNILESLSVRFKATSAQKSVS